MGGRTDLLVVGDDVPEATAVAFSKAGIRHRVVESLEDAIERLPDGSRGVDCLLVCVDRPVDAHWGSLAELRELFPALPVVIRLPPDAESSLRGLLEAGPIDYIRPVDLKEHGEIVARRVRSLADLEQPAEGDGESTADRIGRAVEALTAVQDATAGFDPAIDETIDRILEVAADRLGYPIGYVTRITDGKQEIVAATGDHGRIQPGTTDPLERTYCRKTIESESPVVLEDALEGGWEDDPAFEQFGLRCYVGASITVDGSIRGTVCFADRQPRDDRLGEIEPAIIETLARLIGYELERDRYETELGRRSRRWQTLFEQAPDGILIHDAEGKITDVNRAATDALGYTEDELLSMNVFDIEVEIDREELLGAWETTSSDAPLTMEGVHRRNDGTTYPAGIWINDIEFDGERRFIAIARDISERKEYERQLSALHDTTRAFIDAESKRDVAETAIDAARELLGFTLPAVWTPTDDGDGLTLFANAAEHQRMIENAAVSSTTVPRDHWTAEAIETNETVVNPRIAPSERAVDIPVRSAIALPLGEHGLLTCGTKAETEFDERDIRAAEILAQNMRVALNQLDQQTALERQQTFTDNLLDAIEDVIFVLDSDGTLKRWNEALERVSGYDGAELESMRVAELFAEDDRETIERVLEEAFETGRTRGELKLSTDDGETIPYDVIATVFTDPTGEPILTGIGRDRTAHIEYERELERYKDLVENVPVGIFRNTPGDAGEFIEVNPAMVEMFDADSEEALLNREVRSLYADPEQRRRFSERLETERIVTEEELRQQTLSGEPFWSSVTAIASTVDGETYFDGVLQDITDRKEYERTLEEQRDRLELLNQVVRHDVRNDMQIVRGRAQLLEEYVDDGEEHLSEVQRATDQVIELTKTARVLTETMLQQQEELQPVRLARPLESQLEAIRSKHDNAVIRMDGRLPEQTVLADEMLEAVFRNLLQNAVIHNDKEVPEVAVETAVEDERAVVRIADNGPGVPDSQKAEIFGKGEKGLDSPGTGIGLYLVETLVDSYGGEIRVEDNDPEGSVFVVELPLEE